MVMPTCGLKLSKEYFSVSGQGSRPLRMVELLYRCEVLGVLEVAEGFVLRHSLPDIGGEGPEDLLPFGHEHWDAWRGPGEDEAGKFSLVLQGVGLGEHPAPAVAEEVHLPEDQRPPDTLGLLDVAFDVVEGGILDAL
jgi:hypothetical protein